MSKPSPLINFPFPPCGGRMRRLSEAQPSLAEAGWGVAHRQVRSAGALKVYEATGAPGHIAPSRARAAIAALPPIQLRLGSLCSPRLRILPPQGGDRKSTRLNSSH